MKEVNVVADKSFGLQYGLLICTSFYVRNERVYFVQTITSKWNGNRCFDYQFSIVWLKQNRVRLSEL